MTSIYHSLHAFSSHHLLPSPHDLSFTYFMFFILIIDFFLFPHLLTSLSLAPYAVSVPYCTSPSFSYYITSCFYLCPFIHLCYVSILSLSLALTSSSVWPHYHIQLLLLVPLFVFFHSPPHDLVMTTYLRVFNHFIIIHFRLPAFPSSLYLFLLLLHSLTWTFLPSLTCTFVLLLRISVFSFAFIRCPSSSSRPFPYLSIITFSSFNPYSYLAFQRSTVGAEWRCNMDAASGELSK